MANGVSILTWVGGEGYQRPATVVPGEAFVEIATETSKTKIGRCVTIVGTTKGPARVEVACALRAWWAACEMPIRIRVEEGWRVESPDYWVVQIPLMGVTVSATKMDRIRAWLGNGDAATSVERVSRVSTALLSELADKARVREPVAAKMFMNVLGGAKADPELARARHELRDLGIETELTKAPLIFKTRGKTRGAVKDSVWYPQPMQVSSTYSFLHRTIDAAYESLRDRDPEFSMRLGGDREEPEFAHNTWRRLAATAAEEHLQAGRCKAEAVELHMGWNLKKHSKEMRLHYAERGARAARARMTEMI